MSSTTAGSAPIASRSSLVGAATEVAAALDRAPVGLASDHEIMALTEQAEALGREVDALRVKLAGEIDARAAIDSGDGSMAQRFGCRNATELLQRVTLVSTTVASKRFALARATRAEIGFSGHTIPPRFPAVAAALESHAISCESAEIITRTLGKLPANANPDDVAHAEQCLVAASCGTVAPGETAAELPAHTDSVRTMCQAWAAAIDQDGLEPDFDVQQQRRYFRFGREAHGLVPVHGALSPEVAATFGRLFDAINSPRAGGSAGAEGPEGSVYSAGSAESTGSAGSPGGVRFIAVDEAVELGVDADNFAPCDPRTPDQKRHDAIAVIAQAASQHEDVPVLGGAPVTVLIQVEAEQLRAKRGVAWVHGHDGVPTPISITGAEHSACAGATQRIVQDVDGRIVELGNQQRIFTAHQRRAIALRDGGCVIPGCTVPATWCEIHHVTEYANGGATHTDNGATLCWYHHRSLGTSGWEIRMHNGTPEVLAPRWVDPHGTWRRAHSPLRPPGLERRRRRTNPASRLT